MKPVSREEYYRAKYGESHQKNEAQEDKSRITFDFVKRLVEACGGEGCDQVVPVKAGQRQQVKGTEHD